MPLITMDFSTIGGAFTEFGTVFESAWDIITGNWVLASVIGIPIIAGIIATIVALFRSR